MIGLNNKKIGFIIDSSSNVKNGEFNDIFVIPLGIIINEKVYSDGIDINQKDIELYLAKKCNNVKTSQATIKNMIDLVKKISEQYDIIFVLPIHEKISGNINSWNMIKSDFPKVRVVMSYDIGESFLWTINEIKLFLKNNEASEGNVQKFINDKIIPNRVGWLMINDLTQLVLGGRVSNLKAKLAKIIKIKPIILFDKNGLNNFSKAKSNAEYFNICNNYISKNFKNKKIKRTILFLPNNENIANNFKNDWLKVYANIKYEEHNFPCVVVCHTGIDYVAQYVELE